jgi:hypothetical protein
MIFRVLVTSYAKVPPPAPSTIAESPSMKEPLAPVFVVRSVPPSRVYIEPAVVDTRSELLVFRTPPALIVTDPAPSPTVPPLKVTTPSSTIIAAAVVPGELDVPVSVTVYAPTASVPAEKTDVSPAVQAPVDDSPFGSVLQNKLLPHVPEGDSPAPVKISLPSQ